MPEKIKPIDTFFEKISKLQDWQQDILVRLIRHGKNAVINSQIHEILSIVKFTFQIPFPENSIAPSPIKITRNMLQEDLLDSDDITLYKIDDIRNVNALADIGIEFAVAPGAGLTIVYGRNGSGKSGFIRILKAISAFRNKESEPVYKNCMTGDKARTSAKIHIGDIEYLWTDGDTGTPFSRKIRVFDSKNAEMYVKGDLSNGKTEILYSPDCFKLLDDLAEILGLIREKLDHERMALVNPYQILNQKLQSEGIKTIEINSVMENNDVMDMFFWEDKKEIQWLQIKDLIENKKSLQVQKRLLKTQLEANKYLFQLIEKFLSIENIKELFMKTSEQKSLSAALQGLRKITENNNPLQGVCSDGWNDLWKSAVEFMKGDFPKNEGIEICPLCMQEIADDAKERIEKFHKWINNDLKRKLDDVEDFLAQKRQLLKSIKSKISIPENLAGAMEIDAAIRDDIALFFANALANFNLLSEKASSGDFQENEFMAVSIYKKLFGEENIDAEGKDECVISQLDNIIVQLGEQNTIEQLILYEKLKANRICCELYRDIDVFKIFDKAIEGYEKSSKACSTTTISKIKTTLNKLFLGDRFNELVEDERHFFNFPYKIAFSISSQSGKAMQSLAFDNAGNLLPSQFMSEGEAKIASLSCFLAEYKMSDAKIPLVFDDPVTSLDHNFQGLVVKRLIELAKETQIIVFTHHFVFSNELCREAEAASINPTLTYLKFEKGISGVAHSGDWEIKKVPTKIQFIREELSKLDDGEYNAIRSLGGKIREIWEQSIEDILFNGTITRLTREIKTQSLEEVRIDDDIYPIVKSGMTKTSAWANHSQAAAVDSIVTKADISSALDELSNFIILVKGKKAKRTTSLTNKII